MELKYHYKNVGSALQAKIRTEQILDYEELGKDFMEFYKESFARYNDFIEEDKMTELTKKIFFSNNSFGMVVANWFLQSKYITSFAVLESLIESSKNAVIKYSVFKNAKSAARKDGNGHVLYPNERYVFTREISDYAFYVDNFVYINSFVSLRKGHGRTIMKPFLQNFMKVECSVLLAAGFLFAGDYDYNLIDNDTGALDKLVSYYEKRIRLRKYQSIYRSK